jgi:hypothetical protein
MHKDHVALCTKVAKLEATVKRLEEAHKLGDKSAQEVSRMVSFLLVCAFVCLH